MAIEVIENYTELRPINPQFGDEIQCEMGAALRHIARELQGMELEPASWSKQIFANPTDAVRFIHDLVKEKDDFRIRDNVYFPFVLCWDFDHFNNTLQLAQLLVREDEELSRLMQDDDDLFPPGPWWI
ncbi:hypothetical protein [Burkholderia ubonensis]|uniref:hypothetical protein n=1 Tax=Burkholderia ubonensis TaxID=101571 RepID=UPI000755AE66|nr:hypothetical protein [Burkholderia ubonensis]KVD26002.1 hypothetical protein WI82_16170 [Burkholderia ubonensis]